MDTSAEYVKMCEVAYPILGERKPQAWDWWWMTPKCEAPRLLVVSGYETDGGEYGPMLPDGGGYITYTFHFPVWRQDQLQEMVGEWSLDWQLRNIAAFYHNVLEDNVASWEQLWLAFVMAEKYGKVWSGEKWEPKQP